MQYLTYAEYKSTGGTLDSAAFTRLEFMARKLIDTYTFNRLTSITTPTETVKMLVFELVEIANDEEQGIVTSTSNDGYSESHQATDHKKKSLELIYSYLANETAADGTPLLYRGVN
ncbi:MAG: hypothetical protein RSB38_07205 [Oscillospiraceae bacterium]